MITTGLVLLFLGLIVFGPKKTIEIAQNIGMVLAQVKHATGQFQTQMPQEMLRKNQGSDGAGGSADNEPQIEKSTPGSEPTSS
jgi:Sec-independent protein translocase protein TatA